MVLEEYGNMANLDFFLFEDDYKLIQRAGESLLHSAEAKAVFLIDKNGQQISASGSYEDIDTTSLATLTAGNVAATDGLAKLLGEAGFTILFHEGEDDNIHISKIGETAILLVIFDDQTSVGMVRLRVKQITPELEQILADAINRKDDNKIPAVEKGKSKIADITDEDIDNLFK
jgi:predicted regulator of Ras-like GTPase activity (Roadblock/LC7/MglB family)